MNSFFQSFSFLPMIHSIRAVVKCAQSTNRVFKLAQEKRRPSALGRSFYYILRKTIEGY